MKNIAILILVVFFSSCSTEPKTIKIENIKLTNKVKSLNFELDSLKNLPSLQFESIISKDISLDSLRTISNSKYILPPKQNELKTSCITYLLYSIKKTLSLNQFSKKKSKRYIYGHLVSYNEHIEKYGHQIMRMTHDETMIKFERLNKLQKDHVLNWNLFEKYNIKIKFT